MTCPACGAAGGERFYEAARQPTNTMLLLADEAEATALPTGEVRLILCLRCSFIWNAAFDPALAEYSQRYEASQSWSPTYERFARKLAEGWVDRYGLRGATVVEIGCDKGDFLALFCEVGDCTGTGIDPAATARAPRASTDGLQFLAESYGLHHQRLRPDAVVCRHTLEHIAPVREFLDVVRATIGPETIILFEVPDAERVMRESAFWDVYYEHCSYFTAGSLRRLFETTGFDVLELRREYGDQYLVIEARVRPVAAADRCVPSDLPAIRELSRAFGSGARDAIAGWRARLGRGTQLGKPCVVWGGGSKGASFVGAIGPDAGIVAAVDVNPYKQGKFMSVGSLPVIGPDELPAVGAGVVIAMNPLYVDEIRAEMDRVGVTAELLTL